VWSSDQDNCLNTIKQILLKNIPLYNFHNDLPIFIRSDAMPGQGLIFSTKSQEKNSKEK